MIVISKLILAIITACFFSASVFGQDAYSESRPFDRDLPEKKEKRKEKEAPTSPSIAVVAGPRSITIPVSVFERNGAPLIDLSKADFTVFIDGVAVPIEAFERPTSTPNVVLLLDMSPSAFLRIEDIRAKARNFVLSLPSATNVMVAEFHSQLNIRAHPSSERDEIEKGISNTKMGDGTSLYTAIQTLSQKVLPTLTGRTVVVLFTDGVDTTSTSGTYRSSVLEVGKGAVSIYPVYYDTSDDRSGRSVRPWLDPFQFPPGTIPTRGIAGMSGKEYQIGREYLEDLAAASGGRVFPAAKFDAAMKSLAAELGSRFYLQVPVPGNVDSRREIKVRIGRPGLKVIARGTSVEN